jgi:integral membrane sensor domain MASE1
LLYGLLECRPILSPTQPAINRIVQSNELAAPLAWAAAYFLAGLACLYLHGAIFAGGHVWLPAGITVAALWLTPLPRWFALLVLIIAAQVGLGALEQRELWRVLLLAFNETGVAAVAVALLHPRPRPLSGLAFVRALLLVAGGASVASALLGAGWQQVTQGLPFASSLRLWIFSELVGILLVTPALLLCVPGARAHPRGLARGEFLIGLACLAGMLATTYLSFNSDLDRRLLDVEFATSYLPLLLLAVLTLAWGARSGAWAALLLALLAMVYDARGGGPFVKLVQLHASNALLELQVYLGVAALLALFVGAFKTRRGQQLDEAERSRRELHLALAASRQVAYVFDVQTRCFTWQGDVAGVLGVPTAAAQTLDQVLALVSPLDQARLRQRWLDGEDPARVVQMPVRLQDGSAVLDRSRPLPRSRDAGPRVGGVWLIDPAD